MYIYDLLDGFFRGALCSDFGNTVLARYAAGVFESAESMGLNAEYLADRLNPYGWQGFSDLAKMAAEAAAGDKTVKPIAPVFRTETLLVPPTQGGGININKPYALRAFEAASKSHSSADSVYIRGALADGLYGKAADIARGTAAHVSVTNIPHRDLSEIYRTAAASGFYHGPNRTDRLLTGHATIAGRAFPFKAFPVEAARSFGDAVRYALTAAFASAQGGNRLKNTFPIIKNKVLEHEREYGYSGAAFPPYIYAVNPYSASLGSTGGQTARQGADVNVFLEHYNGDIAIRNAAEEARCAEAKKALPQVTKTYPNENRVGDLTGLSALCWGGMRELSALYRGETPRLFAVRWDGKSCLSAMRWDRKPWLSDLYRGETPGLSALCLNESSGFFERYDFSRSYPRFVKNGIPETRGAVGNFSPVRLTGTVCTGEAEHLQSLIPICCDFSMGTVYYDVSEACGADISPKEIAEIRETKESCSPRNVSEIRIALSGMSDTVTNETDMDKVISYITDAVAEASRVVSERAYN